MQSAMDVHIVGNVSFPYGWLCYEEKIKVHEPWKRYNPIINAIRGVPCYMKPYTTNIETHLLTLMLTTTCYKAKLIKWSYLLHMLHPQSLWMSNSRCDGCARHYKGSFPRGWQRYEKEKVHEPWRKSNPIINAIRGALCHMESCTTSIEAHGLHEGNWVES